MTNLKKLCITTLALCLALVLAACGGGASSGSAPAADVSSAPPSTPEDAAPTYSQTFTYQDVTYTIQPAGFFAEQKGTFETAGGDFNFTSGATAKEGSILGVSNLMKTSQYETLTLVAFTVETALTGEERRAALDAFAAYLPLDTGDGQSTATRQLYEGEEGTVVCLLYSAPDLQGVEFDFYTQGGETALVQTE